MGRTFKQWCEVTSWHGFIHLQHAKTKCGRVGWTIVLTLALFILISQADNLIKDYFDGKDAWATSTDQVFEPDGFPSPTITVCNYNRLRRSAAAEYNFTHDLIKYFFQHTFFFGQYLIHKHKSIAHASNYTAWRKEKNMTYEKILKAMSHQCEDMLIFVQSAYLDYRSFGDVCHRTMQNDNITVKEIVTAEYGLCYQVEFNPDEKMALTGTWGSTTLLLNAQIKEYMHWSENNYIDEGFALQITYNGQIIPGKWITVMPGQHSWIGMSTRHEKLRETPSKIVELLGLGPPCDESAKMPSLPDADFDVSTCYVDCYRTPLAKQCGCYPLVRAKELPPCELEVIDQCLRVNATFRRQYNAEVKECHKTMCTPPCERVTIQTSLSTSRFPSLNQLDHLRETLQDAGVAADKVIGKLERNIALVDIYYSSLNVEVLERYRKNSFAQVLSNIGGQMGLWMGISIITLLHTLLSCCYGCKELCKRKTIEPKHKDSYDSYAPEKTSGITE